MEKRKQKTHIMGTSKEQCRRQVMGEEEKVGCFQKQNGNLWSNSNPKMIDVFFHINAANL